MLKRYLLAATLAGGGHAVADPKFEYGKADELKQIEGTEYDASVAAGIVLTTGNSETTTATASVKGTRKQGNNKLQVEGSATYANAGLRVLDDRNANGIIDDETEIVSVKATTAESIEGKLRYDRFLTESNSLFAAVLANRNVPAGRRLVLGAQLGYSRQLYKSEQAEAVGELGGDYSNEDLNVGEDVQIVSARAFIGYKAEMTEGTTFETSLESLTNLNEETLPTGVATGPGQDTRLNFKASVAAKIGKNLAVQTSIEARYDNRPGPLPIKNLAMGFVPEATRLDTIMKAQLIYTL